jgi:flagellar protein FliS
MHTNRYQNYIEEELLTADPVRLIQLLYRGALDSITSARRYLKLGDIRARSRSISKAMTIVTELSLSLNHTAGGELSKNLAEVYAYTQTLLIQANVKQSDSPLEEAERLLSTCWTAGSHLRTRQVRRRRAQRQALPTSRSVPRINAYLVGGAVEVGGVVKVLWWSIMAFATASAGTSYLPDCTASRSCSSRRGSPVESACAI